MDIYFNNTQLLQNTLLSYFDIPLPLVSLNKRFSNLNYEKYNTHIQPHGIIESYHIKTKNIYQKIDYKPSSGTRPKGVNGKLNGLFEEWYDDSKV